MRVAYVAGPFNAATEEGIKENIQRACDVSVKYWQKGFAVVCPHTNTALRPFTKAATAETIDTTGVSREQTLAGDIAIMLKCDLIVMMKGWQNSTGATYEHQVATEHGMEIVYE